MVNALPKELLERLSEADAKSVRLLTERESQALDQLFLQANSDGPPPSCGCIDTERFESGRRVESDLRGADEWLMECGIDADTPVHALVITEDYIEAPWDLLRRNAVALFATPVMDDGYLAAADHSWILGVCHHDLLSFGRGFLDRE